jgi:hypothetical protein
MVTIVVCKSFSLYFYVRYFQFYFCKEPKKTQSDRCNTTIECLDNVGLVCSRDEKSFNSKTNKKCECIKEIGNENYWDNGKCHKAKEISHLGCMNNEWCQTLTQGTFCNKTNKKCECIKEIGNENYWDKLHGKCISASVYNKTCHYDSQCQTHTQQTVCNKSILICDCSPDKYWNGTRCGKF